jgi:hypothetical protein
MMMVVVAHPSLNFSRANKINLSVGEGLNKNIDKIGGIFYLGILLLKNSTFYKCFNRLLMI